MVRRQTELMREVNAETHPRGALHSRARAAHVAANRAALDALGRAGRTLSTAAGRLTDGYYPATRIDFEALSGSILPAIKGWPAA